MAPRLPPAVPQTPRPPHPKTFTPPFLLQKPWLGDVMERGHIFLRSLSLPVSIK